MTIRSTLFAVTLLCLVGFANQVIAQSALAASAPTTEIAVLKAQLESSRQFHDSFVSMVQWAFGTAIAITLLLAAFGWFTNKSNYDRDRLLLSQQVQMIREEIQTAFNERTQTFKAELSAGLSARQSEIETTVRKAI